MFLFYNIRSKTRHVLIRKLSHKYNIICNRLTVVENSTRPLVSTSARQCRTRKDIPGTRPTGRVCTSTDRRENPMTAV